MTSPTSNPDITVRGGIINVPPSTQPTQPLRHQPNTPRTKKRTTTKPDHQVYTPDPSTTPDPIPEPAPAPMAATAEEPTEAPSEE